MSSDPTDPDRLVVASVIQALLDRPAVAGEVDDWLASLSRPLDVALLASSLKLAPEYQRRQMLYMRQLGGGPVRTSPPLFVLHIPKTAGTALRLALESAMGLPALMFTDVAELLGGERYTGNAETFKPLPRESWPLLSGHNHLDDYPPGHLGVTLLREPRSRILSLYRFTTGPQYLDWSEVTLGSENRARVARRAGLDFAKFLDDGYPYEEMPSHWWLMHGHGADGPEDVRAVSDDEVLESVRVGVTRLRAAAWQHRAGDIAHLVQRVAGRAGDIARANVTPHDGQTIPLTAKALARLDALVATEMKVFELLGELGVLPRLTASQAEMLFERTARKLGFTLP
jgi:hypothetical protein